MCVGLFKISNSKMSKIPPIERALKMLAYARAPLEQVRLKGRVCCVQVIISCDFVGKVTNIFKNLTKEEYDLMTMNKTKRAKTLAKKTA